jgi:hypothetical protein
MSTLGLPTAITTAPVYLTGIAGRALGISLAGRRLKSRCASSNESGGISFFSARILRSHHAAS